MKDVGLPPFIGDLVPVVEFTWSSPASKPSAKGTTWTAAPGLIYIADWGQIGVEALIPLNRTTGTTVGAVALLHLFLDDLLPTSHRPADLSNEGHAWRCSPAWPRSPSRPMRC